MARERTTLLDHQIDAYVNAIASFRSIRAELMRQAREPGVAEWLENNKATLDLLQEQAARLRQQRFSSHPFADRA